MAIECEVGIGGGGMKTGTIRRYPFTHYVLAMPNGYWAMRLGRNGLCYGGKWVSFNDVVWC